MEVMPTPSSSTKDSFLKYLALFVILTLLGIIIGFGTSKLHREFFRKKDHVFTATIAKINSNSAGIELEIEYKGKELGKVSLLKTTPVFKVENATITRGSLEQLKIPQDINIVSSTSTPPFIVNKIYILPGSQ